ncbi:MAG: DUF4148 domain-containing protein [Burkholderiales bacterium]|nr:DUF4148 domain-containing protein [Burkholderiales bacterium]MBH2016993.1 DUF4148 domain-containing protein [Burkholderiales bacterium]
MSIVLATALVASLMSTPAWAQSSTESPRPLSREEVLADAALAKRAGLDRFQDPEIQLLMPEAYAAAQAEYRKLREGVAFQQEVSRIKLAQAR